MPDIQSLGKKPKEGSKSQNNSGGIENELLSTVKKQAIEGYASGQLSLNDAILGYYSVQSQLAQLPVQKPGTVTGLLPALSQLAQGKGFKPLAPQVGPLGEEGAANLIDKGMKFQTANIQGMKAPLEMAELSTKIEQMDPNFKAEQVGREEEARASVQMKTKESEEQNKYFNSILQKKELPVETEKVISFVDSGLSALQEIKSIFEMSPEQLSQLNMPGNPIGQKLGSLRAELENSILRKDSGASITKQDRDMIRQFTVPTGLRAALNDQSNNKLRIDRMITSLEKQKNRLLPNEGIRNFIQESIQAGASRDEIYKYLRERGEA